MKKLLILIAIFITPAFYLIYHFPSYFQSAFALLGSILILISYKFLKGKFSWQEGFGSFSYSHSQIEQVYNYISHQEEHHKQKTFREEYLDFLRKFEIDYDDRYLFDWEE